MQIIKKINQLKQSEIKNKIDERIKEFENLGKNQENLFSELCFCLLTANFQAEKCIEIQEEMQKDFSNLELEKLKYKLKEKGHRFWPQRAERICLARNKEIKKERDWLVENIKGLGMKEASHFLRNIGEKDYAIIDFHILDLLEKENLIKKPKTLTKAKYIEIENKLKEIAEKTNLSLAELDLYLWYLETGKVLK